VFSARVLCKTPLSYADEHVHGSVAVAWHEQRSRWQAKATAPGERPPKAGFGIRGATVRPRYFACAVAVALLLVETGSIMPGLVGDALAVFERSPFFAAFDPTTTVIVAACPEANVPSEQLIVPVEPTGGAVQLPWLVVTLTNWLPVSTLSVADTADEDGPRFRTVITNVTGLGGNTGFDGPVIETAISALLGTPVPLTGIENVWLSFVALEDSMRTAAPLAAPVVIGEKSTLTLQVPGPVNPAQVSKRTANGPTWSLFER
jgi:hypothetical protein